MTRDVLELARERSLRGEPYVLATVVWRRAPASAKHGSKALIGPDGKLIGWLGGACAEPAVIREALVALRDRAPRLIRLGPADELEGLDRDGMITVPIACQSQGALEVYLEPMLPAPQLVTIGRSPAVDTLAAMARTLGWRTVIVDDGGAETDHPDADLVVTTLDLDAAGVTHRSLVVVATQGHYDELALERALAAEPAYVGLVASRQRASAVLDYLSARGAPAVALERVRAPAGLDLGHVAHEEIAVAILAELVQLRAAGEIGWDSTVSAGPEQAVDPVCGMAVDVARSHHRSSLGGRDYHFCSATCRASFGAEPARYIAVERATS